ncbi:MAG: sensor histidine kinase [Puniceicoccaceae bacterium]
MTARITALLICWVTGGLAIALGQSIDPRSPEEWRTQIAMEELKLDYWLPARIRQLEIERNHLLAKISKLPLHDPKPLTGQYGYHSLVRSSDSKFHYLTADTVYNQQLNSIGLVPALNPFDPQAGIYAFPKRFKIEILPGTEIGEEVNGIWVPGPDTGEWEEVVNWLNEDFPDPGPYPVVFSEIKRDVSQVRLVVPVSDSENEPDYYALGEFYLFRGQDGKIADNISTFGSSGVAFSASDTLSLDRAWNLDYVYDGISVLGLPLSENTTNVEDFVVRFPDHDTQPGPVQIVLDIGEPQRIGRIELWPTAAPEGMVVPLFGFPGEVVAEISLYADFRESREIPIPNPRVRMHNDNLLTIIGDGEIARYVRLTFSDFFEFMDASILGIGEISVLEYGEVFSLGCEISATGIPEDAVDQLPRLVDGFSRQRKILPETDWIVGLAKRRPLDARLEFVEHELTSAQQKWRAWLLRMSIFLGAGLFILLFLGLTIQKRQRRREVNRLKVQITRDLHDEVGSSLGSLSLASEHLERMASDELIREELGEISLTAREANASLLEVVWMTDQTTVFLSDLVKKLIQRAEKVLRGVEVISDVSPDCPEIEVNLTAKRHVVSFFKEAIHNCARHAQATRVLVNVHQTKDHLELTIHDNGCGFDASIEHEGWGLGSMRKRATELGGDLNINSSPNKGTEIILDVPLANLTTDPTHLYKTSN